MTQIYSDRQGLFGMALCGRMGRDRSQERGPTFDELSRRVACQFHLRVITM